MKEEEIIIILKDMIGCDRREYNSTQVYAIQGLLDLYEKEKEKNIELLEKIENEKILFVRKDHTTKEMLCEYYIRKDEIEKKYISKDKIRKKIKVLMEFDKKYKTYTSDDRENFSIEYFKAKTLQELLEEE